MSATLELAVPQRKSINGQQVVRLAVAGCGVVGSELVRLLQQQAAALQHSYGLRVEVTRVLVRDVEKERGLDTPRDRFTTDVESFLHTPADVVVEAIGGVHPALRIAEATLQRGARFITANKALIATHGVQLQRVAARSRTQLQFEAAVGASVPVIRVLRDALGTARPSGIRGILNGTSNFVLTQLEQGVPLADAITEAQRRGLAEADYSRDLDGRDVEDKVAILAWLAYGVPPHTLDATRIGLLPNIERIVGDAHAADARARLIGECIPTDDGLVVNVEPVIVDADSAFGRTTHENNVITLDFGWRAPIQLAGPGAGGLPTATALLADLLDAGSDLSIPAQPLRCIADPRAHAWSISVKSNERAALGLVHAAGITTAIVQLRQDALCFHTAPITRPVLNALLIELEALGAQPVATRLDVARRVS